MTQNEEAGKAGYARRGRKPRNTAGRSLVRERKPWILRREARSIRGSKLPEDAGLYIE